MNYGVILASGVGTRVKSINIPKQYFEIDGKPIIIYTLENMLKDNLFDCIYIAINKDYEEILWEYLDNFIEDDDLDKIEVIYGGKERIDTIHNVMKEICKNDINDEDVIVIHDAVRPFVTKKILNDSIDAARKYGAVVTTLPAVDTMLNSNDGNIVGSIPNRNLLYRGQAPDSFKVNTFIELENNLSDEQKKDITGTSQLCSMNNYPLHMIEGDEINFKITTDFDLKLALYVVRERKNEKVRKYTK